jgi:hypothetical protein
VVIPGAPAPDEFFGYLVHDKTGLTGRQSKHRFIHARVIANTAERRVVRVSRFFNATRACCRGTFDTCISETERVLLLDDTVSFGLTDSTRKKHIFHAIKSSDCAAWVAFFSGTAMPGSSQGQPQPFQQPSPLIPDESASDEMPPPYDGNGAGPVEQEGQQQQSGYDRYEATPTPSAPFINFSAEEGVANTDAASNV